MFYDVFTFNIKLGKIEEVSFLISITKKYEKIDVEINKNDSLSHFKEIFVRIFCYKKRLNHLKMQCNRIEATMFEQM